MELGLRAPSVATQLKISARRQAVSGNTLDRFLHLHVCTHIHVHISCTHTLPEWQNWNYVCLTTSRRLPPLLPFSHHPMDARLLAGALQRWNKLYETESATNFREGFSTSHSHHFALRKRGKPTPMGVSENDNGNLYPRK